LFLTLFFVIPKTQAEWLEF